MRLSNAEEKLMKLIWSNREVFMKDLLELYPAPKPAKTTVATLPKRMPEKGFIAYKQFGNSRQYYLLVDETEYFNNHLDKMISNYFNNS